MVEFLKDVKGENFIFEKGKRYISIEGVKECSILVRQPNSPKNVNWWSEFPITSVNEHFRLIDNTEMALTEMIEENKLLQL